MSVWNTIRIMAGVSADAPGPPLAAAGVALPANSSVVEFRVRGLTTTGNPTAVVLFFWRIQTGTVELIGTQVIQTADNVMPEPKRVISESPSVYVTIGFTGGLNPTASGTVEARGLFGLTDAGIGISPASPAAWGLYQEDTSHSSGDWGNNILAVRRDVPINSAGSDGDYCELGVDPDGYLYVRSKSFDAPSNADRGFEVAPVWSRNVQTPVSILAAAQNFSAAWSDLGPELALQGYTRMGTWIKLTIHDSTNVRLRLLAKHTSAGTNEYMLPITATDVSGTPFNLKVQGEYVELDADADQLILIKWEVDNFIPFVQLQVMAEVAGAVPGHIDEAHVTYGYGG
jgi:hypothetical protein